MTVPATSRRTPLFLGNGVTTSFPFTFKVFQAADLAVVRTDVDGTLSALVLDSDYSVTLNPDQDATPGGSVTYPLIGSPLATGQKLVVFGNLPYSQTLALPGGGSFSPTALERALDRTEMQIQQVADAVTSSIRAPAGETFAKLADASVRANKVQGYDAQGQPTVFAPASGSAVDVLIQLANTVLAAQGAALVGFNPALAYAAGTVGDKLKQLAAAVSAGSLAQYGTLNNDGVTDDAAVFQAAAASGAKIIDARGVNCRIGSVINIPSGQIWLLHGATLTMASSTQTMWSANTVNDWALLGPFRITGDGSTVGTAKAIRVSDCSRWLVDAPTISSIKGWGFYLEPGSSTTARGTHGTLRNPVIHTCYFGYEDLPGTGAEYCTVINPRIYNCTIHGLKTAAGNTTVLGGHIVDNPNKGVHVVNGSNHAHGSFQGVNINHNTVYGIHCEAVLNGHTFDGCHIYQNDIFFDRCKGIMISGGHLDPVRIYNYKDGSSGLNVIQDCYCPGGYGPARYNGGNDGHNELIIRGCWGPGQLATAGGKDTTGVTINDPSMCYVTTQRSAASTQALTSGVSTTLTYSSIDYLYDRRGAQSAGTITIPTAQNGLYRISFDLLFVGTGMSVTASYVEFKVNGTTRKVAFPSIFSTTKLQVQATFDIYLAAGDALRLDAVITGTTPVFGDSVWPSNFTVERIT